MFTHILIAHDLSHEADVALRRAAQLATQYQAKLTLLHVAEGQQSSSAVASLRVAAEQVLGERLATYCHGNAEVRLEAGKASEVIHQILGEGDVDLLVLADVAGVQKVLVDGARALVVELRVRAGDAVQLRLEHGSLHGFLTLNGKRKRIVSRQFVPVNNLFSFFVQDKNPL